LQLSFFIYDASLIFSGRRVFSLLLGEERGVCVRDHVPPAWPGWPKRPKFCLAVFLESTWKKKGYKDTHTDSPQISRSIQDRLFTRRLKRKIDHLTMPGSAADASASPAAPPAAKSGTASLKKKAKKKAASEELEKLAPVFGAWISEQIGASPSTPGEQLKLVHSAAKGLYPVNGTDGVLPPGTELLTEEAVASVIGVAVAPDFCAHCWAATAAPAGSDAQAATDGTAEARRPAGGREVCGGCKVTFYCSADCRDADRDVHRVECGALESQREAIDALISALDIQIDLLRLTLRTLAAKALPARAAGYARLMQLPLNKNLIDPSFWTRTLEACTCSVFCGVAG
jgi:hypothetical protein